MVLVVVAVVVVVEVVVVVVVVVMAISCGGSIGGDRTDCNSSGSQLWRW